jgi:lipopolysaccharide export system permease protein
MPLILQRYLYREVMQSLAAVLAILVLVYLSTRFIRYLAEAAAGNIPGGVILQLLLYKILVHLPVLLPVAFYLGTLLALGRLYQDSEIVAMMASGFGTDYLAKYLFLLAGGVAFFTFGWSLYLSPQVAEMADDRYQKAKEEAEFTGVFPGRFKSFEQGDHVLYVEEVEIKQRRMYNVFVQLRRPARVDVLISARAYPMAEVESGDRFIVLEEGYRYEGSPGSLEFVITRFRRHGVRVEQRSNTAWPRRLESTPTMALLHSARPMEIAEFQWRISMPLSVVLLGLLAIPLARTSPRQGRYAKLFAALLIYFVYSNLLGVAQKLVEQGELSPLIGVWPVHGIAAFVLLTWFWADHLRAWWRKFRFRPMGIRL